MIFAKATLVPNPKLSRFIDDTISPSVRKSVEAACQVIQRAAQGYCPVDTGALRDSITYSVEQVAFERVTGTVGPHMPYSDYVEFGTGQRGDPVVPHTDKPGMPAQPYMRPAYDENKSAIVDLFAGNLKTDIGRAG